MVNDDFSITNFVYHFIFIYFFLRNDDDDGTWNEQQNQIHEL